MFVFIIPDEFGRKIRGHGPKVDNYDKFCKSNLLVMIVV